MMDETRCVYYIQLPLAGSPDTWWTVARAITPDGCAEVVRVLVANPAPETMQVRVEIRREI